MSVLARENAYHLIPIHIITGFLGSGKTTLLNRLLGQAGMESTAVIVNEFGTIGIDNLLVQASTEEMVMLEGGCLCCTVRGDLLDTLENLWQKRAAGEIAAFRQVVVETTGLADPAPILRTLLDDNFIRHHYRLDALVTTVDCVYGESQFSEHEQAVKQAALAHHLVLTKSDLVSSTQTAQLKQSLARLNPSAQVHDAQKDALKATALFDSGAYRNGGLEARAWLQADLYRHLPQPEQSRHTHHIRTFCIERDTPLSWRVLEHWLKQLTRLRGKDLLRVKGIAYTCETPLPVVIQGVQHILQAPVTLDKWPGAQPCSQIVFITRNIERETIESNLEALIASATPTQVCAAAMLLL
jgi:G3E family GTPase